MTGVVDTHAHLTDERFDGEVEAVVGRARAAGVVRVITCGTDLASSRRAVDLAERFGEVYAAVGVHPHDAAHLKEDLESVAARLAELSRHPKVVAIGEVGLDYFYDFSPRAVQLQVFRRLVQLAQDMALPLIVHTRDSVSDVLDILAEAGGKAPINGVLHCFAGTLEQARRALDLGLFLGFGGMVTFARADDVREVAAAVPLERLLSETDSPYLAPVPHRGKRNEPAFVTLAVQRLAELHGLGYEAMAAATARNAGTLFARLGIG